MGKDIKTAEAGITKANKFVKEGAASISKKDLRKEKRAKIKAKREQAKSLKGTKGVSKKDIRKGKREDIKAIKSKYKGAKKTLKTLKESPTKKELVGGQHNLPKELKAKIKAAPTKMYGKKSPVKGGWWAHQTKGHGGPSKQSEASAAKKKKY